MAQVPVVGVFAFLFLQLAAGQDAACANALMTLTNNMASCTPTLQNPTIICDGVCRGYFDDIFTACPANLVTVQRQALDSACASTTQGPATTQGPTTNDTISEDCSAALNRLENAPARCTLTSTSNINAVCSGECRVFYDDIIANCPIDDNIAVEFNPLCESLACTRAISGISSVCFDDFDYSDCTGTCGTQLQAVVNACGTNINDTQTEALIRQYNGVCTDACIAAQSAADADTNCANAALDDVTAVCSGTCRTLTDAIINACSVNNDELVEFNRLCGSLACTRAISGISSVCFDDFDYSDCTGTCGTQLQAVVNACGTNINDTQTEALIRQYNGVCTDACIAAQSALNADTICENAVLDDVTAVCSGTCRTLLDAIINACPVSNDELVEFNRLCGSGIMMKASGIILLVAAICVFIF